MRSIRSSRSQLGPEVLVAGSFAFLLIASCQGSGMQATKDGGADAAAGAGATGGTGSGGAKPGSGGRGTGNGGSGGGVLSSCSPAPKCAPSELPVRVQSPALGQTQCTCVSNPCGTAFPNCDCAAAVCPKYFAQCSGYAPDAGFL